MHRRCVVLGCIPVLLVIRAAWGQAPTGEELALALAHEAWEDYQAGDVEEAEEKAEQCTLRYRPGLLGYWVLWQVRSGGETGGYHFDQTAAELAEYGDQDPVAAFQLGIVAEAKGEFKEAAERYRFVLESGLEQAIVYARLGVAEAALGDDEAAAEHLMQALAMDPKWTEPHRRLPVVWAQAGDLDKAKQAAVEAVDLWPEEVALRHELGAIALARGDILDFTFNTRRGTWRESGGWLHWAAVGWALAPNWSRFVWVWVAVVAVMVGLSCASSRRWPQRFDIWVVLAWSLVMAAILSPPAMERYGTFSPSWWRQSFVLLWLAVGAFLISLPIDGLFALLRRERPTKDHLAIQGAWFWLLVVLFWWIRTRHTTYELAFWPPAVIVIGLTVYLRRGFIVGMAAELGPRRRGDYERMIRWLSFSRRLDGSELNRLVVHTDVGDALFLLGRYDEALAASEKAIAAGMRPHSGVAAANAAVACADMAEYQEAWELCQTARDLIGATGPMRALPEVCAAYGLLRQGRTAEALQVAHAASGQRGITPPSVVAAKAVIAHCWALSGQFPTATNLCREVLAKTRYGTWTSLAYVTMGMMWAATARWEEAAREYRAAIAAWPASAEAHLRLAHALANLGRYDEARAELEAATRSAPLHQHAKMAGEMLRRPAEAWRAVPVPMPAGSAVGTAPASGAPT